MGAQAPVARKMDSAIHCINHYPLDSAIGFHYTYAMDSDLSDGQRYPSFELPGPEEYLGAGGVREVCRGKWERCAGELVGTRLE